MSAVSNLSFSDTLFEKLNEMSYSMGMDCWVSGNVCCYLVANPNIQCDDDCTRLFYNNPVECIEFLIHHPEFRDLVSYAPAKDFNDAEECIHSEVKSSDCWWTAQVC